MDGVSAQGPDAEKRPPPGAALSPARGTVPARADGAGPAPATIQSCEYCGAPVRPQFYFCLNCATPYKHVESVLTPAAPLKMTDGLRVERMAPQVVPLFWTYFSVVLVAGLVSYGLFEADEAGIAVLLSSAAVLATTCVFGMIHRSVLAAQFAKIGFTSGYAWLALAALAPLLLLNYGYHLLLTELGAEPALRIEPLRDMMGMPSLVVLICVFPAVAEEIAFRGLLQHWLHVAIRPWRALLIASALFTVLHFTVLSAPYLFLVGMLLGYAKWKTGSLYPSILIHFLHNFIVVALPAFR